MLSWISSPDACGLPLSPFRRESILAILNFYDDDKISESRLSRRCVADRFSRGHRADVSCPMHERVESACLLQLPQRTDTRHLCCEGQKMIMLLRIVY